MAEQTKPKAAREQKEECNACRRKPSNTDPKLFVVCKTCISAEFSSAGPAHAVTPQIGTCTEELCEKDQIKVHLQRQLLRKAFEIRDFKEHCHSFTVVEPCSISDRPVPFGRIQEGVL